MSPSFADFLNDGQKDDLFNQIVNEGTIICHFDETITPKPKDKFIIIASTTSDDALIVYINTDINTNVNKSLQQQGLHLTIKQKDHPDFLNYDSYIDCCHPSEKKLSDLKKELANNPKKSKGCVSTSLLQAIISMIEISPTIKTKTKKKYGITEKAKKII